MEGRRISDGRWHDILWAWAVYGYGNDNSPVVRDSVDTAIGPFHRRRPSRRRTAATMSRCGLRGRFHGVVDDCQTVLYCVLRATEPLTVFVNQLPHSISTMDAFAIAVPGRDELGRR